jgi:hypothetical protein
VLRILFLALILLSLGLEISSIYTSNITLTECSSETKSLNNLEESFFDSFSDDHINQIYEPIVFTEQQTYIPVSKAIFLRDILLVTCWQPPRKTNQSL